MNQLNIKPSFKHAEEAKAPDDMAVPPTKPEPKAEPAVKGTPALRGDIANLDKRVQGMFAAFDKNLSERLSAQDAEAEAASARLTSRIEALEHSVNGIEGLLRIELGPELQRTLDAQLNARRVSVGRPRNIVLLLCIALFGGIAAGAAFHAELSAGIGAGIAAAMEAFTGG